MFDKIETIAEAFNLEDAKKILLLTYLMGATSPALAVNEPTPTIPSKIESAIAKNLAQHPKLNAVVMTYLRDPQASPEVKKLLTTELSSDDLQINPFDDRREMNEKYGFSDELFSFINYNFEFKSYGFDTFSEQTLNSRLDESVTRLRADRPELFQRKFVIFVGDEDGPEPRFSSSAFAFLHLVHELAHMHFIRTFAQSLPQIEKEKRFSQEVFRFESDHYQIHGNVFSYLTERYAWQTQLKAAASLFKPFDDKKYNDPFLTQVKEAYHDILPRTPWHLEGLLGYARREVWDEMETYVGFRVTEIYDLDVYSKFTAADFHRISLTTLLGLK